MRCAELQIQLTEAVSTLAGQKELVAKLEHDLSTIQAVSAVHRPDAEVTPSIGWGTLKVAPGVITDGGANASWGSSYYLLFFFFLIIFFSPFSVFLTTHPAESGIVPLQWDGGGMGWVIVVASSDHPALLLPG